MRLNGPGLVQLLAQLPVWTLPQFIEPVLSNTSASSMRLRGVQHLGHDVDLEHVEVDPETGELGDRQEHAPATVPLAMTRYPLLSISTS